MDLTNLTPKILEASLRALRSGRPPKPEILSIPWSDSANREGNILAFENRVQHLVWESYTHWRQVEGLPLSRPTNRQDALDQIAADFRTANGELAAWSALYFRYLAGVHLSVESLSQAASVVPQHFRRRLNQGLAMLAQRLGREVLENTPKPRQPALPLPEFSSLVGVQSVIDHLARLFTADDGPALVSLEGMGGIGKSAIARAFIGRSEITERWEKLAWVSARQTALTDDSRLTPVSDPVSTLEDVTARLCDQLGLVGLSGNPLTTRLDGLKTALANEKHLIVVDNLETITEYLRLVPALAETAGNSRFLITTRQTLREFAYVHTIPLQELDRSSAYDLLATETGRRGRHQAISEEQFDALYAITGGLPLALKLIAAQLYLRPLGEILDGFRQAKVGIDNLYRYLYWQTWRSMSDPARKLLLAFLPSDPDGEDLEFLRMMSGQPEGDFFAALKELDRFSLLELNGDAVRPLYRLHRLTVTFLQTDILNLWSEQAADE